MGLYLVDPEHGIAIEVPLRGAEERALTMQWDRLKEADARERFSVRFANLLTNVISEAIDWDIKAPTGAQLAYALVLSRKLEAEIPPIAMSSRLEMALFIDKASARLRDG